MPAQTQLKERSQHKPLPPPNTDFYEVTETLNAEELALLMSGPDADLPGFDITAYWSRSGLLALTRDAGAPPTLPIAGSGDHGTAVGLFSAIVMGLYRAKACGPAASRYRAPSKSRRR